MIYLIRNADRTIKTFMERGDDSALQPGETLEVVNKTFIEYAARLRLSVNNRTCEMVQAAIGETVTVIVQAPGHESIDLLVNEQSVNVSLTNGEGELTLTNPIPVQFLIAPADRVNFCAAGEAVIGVEFK
jgi:hypothetical protein